MVNTRSNKKPFPGNRKGLLINKKNTADRQCLISDVEVPSGFPASVPLRQAGNLGVVNPYWSITKKGSIY